MSSLSSEIREWNTPLIGAYLLWRFTEGYEATGERESPEFLFHFVVLPIFESPELLRPINGRRNSFASYVRSFSTDGKLDVLAKLSDRVMDLRGKTMLALEIGFATGLFEWKDNMSRLHALQRDGAFVSQFLAEPLIKLGSKAFRFGTWSSSIPLPVFSKFLGVELT